ncbi:MAG TPA: DoxX family protein [Actinomycetota bacterium]|nr:DoxX family protein [Actinomycetota bacterium]
MSTGAGLVVLGGRVLIAVFYGFFAGLGHLRRSARYEQAATSSGFPIPRLAGWPTGVWLIAGSISVALGIWADVGAVMFAVFLIPAAWYLHPFWKIEDPAARRTQESAFYRNVMMLGASLVMVGTFAALGASLRFTITPPLFAF